MADVASGAILRADYLRHEEDPKEMILRAVGDISGIRCAPTQVLVATYKRPEKTRSGILLGSAVSREDEFQGKVGLVLAAGPLAFADDSRAAFGGFAAQVGDWVMYRASEGMALNLRGAGGTEAEGWHCRLFRDEDIRAVVTDPTTIV